VEDKTKSEDEEVKTDDEFKIDVNKDSKNEDKEDDKEEEEKEPESKPDKKPKKEGGKKKWLVALLVLLLIGLAAGGTWWQTNKQSKEQDKKKQDESTSLQKKIDDKNKEIAKAKSDLAAAQSDAKKNTAVTPSADEISNIQASINSKNTAALEGYMASKVTVIIAASECCGLRTPTQAISDLAYLDSATEPWDWALPAATLTKYRAGSYAQYFPATAVVGKSANKYVVSFSFDDNAKISTIFLAINDDLL